MIKKFARYTLILFVLPLLMSFTAGCNDELGPDDKWPKIVCWEHEEDFTVTMKLIEPFGIPQLKLPDRTINMKIQVQSYNATQEYIVRIFLKNVEWVFTNYTENNLPTNSYKYILPITEVYWVDGVHGDFICGHPPRGTAELEFYWDPCYFPLALEDWISFSIDPDTGQSSIKWISDRYIYHFMCVIEDKDGRTDTFYFDVISELVVETKK